MLVCAEQAKDAELADLQQQLRRQSETDAAGQTLDSSVKQCACLQPC